MARKKQIPVWKAQDIGAEASQLDKANAHTEVTSLSVPTRKTECEMIAGAPAEAAVNLATRLVKLM
ncbi:MAG: hypothetical protein H6Q53_2386, partial [Deltaproteobacteria bacterium]|nr:hypothetical protein [Deltaproteobacteria bacterium]